MSESDPDSLHDEVDLLRRELAAARADQERAGEREARLRKSRDRAVKAADVLSALLAERLRGETAVAGAAERSWWRRGAATVTPEEAGQLELIRQSPLFDAAYYLRSHLDVARRGEDPGVHFLRHWDHPFRRPSEAFDIAQYVLDHPEVLVERVNPLVHFLASAESEGADAYPPARR
ncbi:hypothetical protein [Nocardioides sp. zg-1228]|uniref:hypothetical protein n=1 Tax=Nocardioides sp. zg-1228 TaxID=2763008 RepID=UPI0016423EC8|nr:hypothetical protein [Nocardioides sp. zg-1228]MBC2933218.1 hypothetical protein [Nocardioides sp. zg-1228]QSF56612.1 hypothetical protein JX575_13370 [Nocardioides sp. zg-1228]